MMHHTYKCLETFFLHGPWRLPGDIIELGVGEGSTAPYLAEAAQALGKEYFACDTFSGFPYTEGILTQGRLSFSLEQVQEVFKQFPVELHWVPVVGCIEDTLPLLTNKEFCYAWVDLDLEASTRFALRWLLNKIVPGGIIGIHDYGFYNTPGIKPAVDEEVDWSLYERVKIEAINTIFIRRLQ